MAQQLLETVTLKFVSNVVDRYNIGDLVAAGGVFSNIKSNMRIRQLDNVKSMYVFPHMGDGGIALGAALHVGHMLTGNTDYKFSAYSGEQYTREETEEELRKVKALKYEFEGEKQTAHAAELITAGNYLLHELAINRVAVVHIH